MPGPYDVNFIERYIRSEAKKRGIDPDIAVRVARSEGLAPNTWQSNVRNRQGEREQSYGPFQLFRGGLGSEFERKTGLSLEDPRNVTQQVSFALDKAKSGGWGPWHGWKGDPRAGLSGVMPKESTSATPSQGDQKVALKFPYRLYGGATRPDAISGFNPAFATALSNMYNAAPANVQRELGLNSGFRSYATQKKLWDASDKTGHTVAAPGRSKHNTGTAADLFGFGLGRGRGGRVSQETRDWVNQNAGKFGLYFPMSYEPWHIQLQPSESVANMTSPSSAPSVTVSGATTAPVGPVSASTSPPPDLGKALGGEEKDKPLSGLLGDMMQQQSQQPAQAPQAPQFGGAGQGQPSLAEYVQQYLASRMQGGQGGQGGSGGQLV